MGGTHRYVSSFSGPGFSLTGFDPINLNVGAILPGYDYSHWKEASPLAGLKAAGVAAYRSSFALSVPDGVDATFAVSFAAPAASNFRALLFINGWQFGRYTNYGPQTVFPVRHRHR